MDCRHWEEELSKQGCEYRKVDLPDGRYLQHGEHGYYLGKPECAFSKDGKFLPNNWTCRLLDRIREYVFEFGPDKNETWSEDDTVAILAYPDKAKFMVLSYYKHRGRVSGFWIIENYKIRSGKESDAIEFLELKEAKKC